MTNNPPNKSTAPGRSAPKRPIIIGATLLLAIAATLTAINLINSPSQTDAPTEDTTETAPPAVTTSSDQTETPTTDGHTPLQYEGADPADSGTITGVISHSSVDGDTLVIRVTTDQLLGSAGSCELTLSPSSGSPYTASAPTIDNPSSGTCQGFDIPLSSLSAGQTYKISVKVTSGEKSGTMEGSIDL